MSTDISTPAQTDASKVLYSAIKEYAASKHVYDIGSGDMDRMLSAAMTKLSGLGPKALANLSASGSTVLDAVQTSFAQVYGTPGETQRQAQQLQQASANGVTSSGHRFATAGIGGYDGRALAMRDDGERGAIAERTSSTHYKSSLPSDAISYAKSLGIDPIHSGFFSGGSPEMRSALRDAITKGASITDDKVKNMNDVKMVIGAIRAGKMKPDDPRIPPSVKGVIEDMKKKGIDPVKGSSGQINKYFKENPDKLKEVKKEAAAEAKSTVSGLTSDQAVQKGANAAERAVKVAEKKDKSKKPNRSAAAPTVARSL